MHKFIERFKSENNVTAFRSLW